MLKKTVASLVVLGIFTLSAQADAAMMAYLYIKGQKSGEVKGSVTQKGREGSIAVIAFEQATKIPMAGGVQSGKPLVGQIVLTKEVDKSSPILRQMLDNNENISMASIKFWTPQMRAATGVGSEVQYYTINLTNARITSMKTNMLNIRNPLEVKYDIDEVLNISYEKADWIWMDGGVTASELGGYAPPQ